MDSTSAPQNSYNISSEENYNSHLSLASGANPFMQVGATFPQDHDIPVNWKITLVNYRLKRLKSQKN
jgi:hypothetical protein